MGQASWIDPKEIGPHPLPVLWVLILKIGESGTPKVVIFRIPHHPWVLSKSCEWQSLKGGLALAEMEEE